jgi:fatty-acyl-CoA synthase
VTTGRTLVEALDAAADSTLDGLRLLDRHGTAAWLPWATVVARARAVAGSLQALGVTEGERVALVFPTTIEFFDTCFGVVLAGAVPVPLYPPVRLGRLEEYHARTAAMVRRAGAGLVLADRRVRRVLGQVIDRTRPPRGCWCLDELPGGAWRRPGVGEGDLGLVQFSSGTTGDPRAVALSHRALVTQASMLNTFWPASDPVRHSGVSWLPLYHDMGLIGAVMTALVRPGTVTVIPPESFLARPATWLRAISDYRATISPAPNFAYSLCEQRIADEEMDGVDLSTWRIALNGAEQAVPDVMRAFARRFARWGFRPEALTPVYGLSEAALAVTFSDIARPFVARRFDRDLLAGAGRAVESPDGREVASVGTAVPGVEVRVIGRTGERMPDGTVGEIECRSPSLMDGYLGQPRETQAAIVGGWLKTGDLGFVCEGELYVSGRAKDMLLLKGRNHAPEDVERAADAVPGIRTGCVTAVSWLPEGADSERLLVLVEAQRQVAAARYPEIADACLRAVAASTGLVPDAVRVLPPGTLPRTSSGKLRRQEALRAFLADRLQPPSRVTPLLVARALARSAVAFLRSRLAAGRRVVGSIDGSTSRT